MLVVFGPQDALGISVVLEQARSDRLPSVERPSASVLDAEELNVQIRKVARPFNSVTVERTGCGWHCALTLESISLPCKPMANGNGVRIADGSLAFSQGVDSGKPPTIASEAYP